MPIALASGTFVGATLGEPQRVPDPLPWGAVLRGAALALELAARARGASGPAIEDLRGLLADPALIPRPLGGEGPVPEPDPRLVEAADGWVVLGTSLLPVEDIVAILDGGAVEGGARDRLARWIGRRDREFVCASLQELRFQATPVHEPAPAELGPADVDPSPSDGELGPGVPTVLRAPLAGTTILDLTHLWAGPLCTRILASLGATVIKVEGPRHPDRLRLVSRDRRFPAYGALNEGKRSVGIDLGTPAGKALFEIMLERVDGVVDNYSPRAFFNWGIDPARSASDCGLVWVSAPAFSAAGTRAGWACRGAGLEGTSGLAWIQGDDQRPGLMRFPMTDPVVGIWAAVAYLGAPSVGIHREVDQSRLAAELAWQMAANGAAGMPNFSDHAPADPERAPLLGEHTLEVIAEFGITTERIRHQERDGLLSNRRLTDSRERVER